MKNKGFTLVEILAVIVILGIIATIAIMGISNIIKSSKERYYEKQEDLVIVAGKTYYADHRSKLPYEIGTISSVNVSTLVEEKYIEPVVDANKQSCSSDTSKVYVQKVTDEEYRYWGYLECNTAGYVSSTDTTKPSISFSPNNTVGTATSQVKVTMTVTDNKQVASYRYVITKDGVEYKDSGYKTYEKTVTIDLTNNGTYTIKGYAYDTSGNKNEKTSGTYTIKITAPDCNAITVTSTTAKNTWINKDITINVTKGSGVQYYTLATNENGKGYKNQIKNSTKNGKIVLSTEGKTKVRVKGYNSESNSCQKDIPEYYIDKTKPTTPNITNLYNNTWINKGYTIKIRSADPKPSSGGEQSGIAYYQYKYGNGNWNTYSSSSGNSYLITINQEINQTLYIRSCDRAGNCSSAASTILKIDLTKPTCISSGGSSNWYNTNRTIKGTCYDTGGSGCQKNISKTLSSEQDTFVTPGTVYDRAGNLSVKCPVQQVRIDKTPPTIKFTPGSGTYHAKLYSTLSVYDSLSGLAPPASGGAHSFSETTVYSTKGIHKAGGVGVWKDLAGNKVNIPSVTYKVQVYTRDYSCSCERYNKQTSWACPTVTKAYSCKNIDKYNCYKYYGCELSTSNANTAHCFGTYYKSFAGTCRLPQFGCEMYYLCWN